MKWLHGYKARLVLVGVVAASVVGGEIVKADFIFGEPTIVPNVNGTSSNGGAFISPDGLELYINSSREPIAGECHNNIWVSKRPTTKDPWSTPVKLDPPLNSANSIWNPSISADGLELYFSDTWPGFDSWDGCTSNPDSYGFNDLWVSRRKSKDDPWGPPENLGPLVNSECADDAPCISADGLSLYFHSERPGCRDNPSNTDIFVTTRPTKADPWGEPVKLGPNVNNEWYEYAPFVSPDGLSLFFSRGTSRPNMYVCRRTKTTDPWGPAELFAPVNSGNAEYGFSFSEEDSTLYFARGTSVFTYDWNIWQVEVTPIVDFNGDGAVDTLDIYELVDHWGRTDNSLYDIAPAPFGDGLVDVRDLAVLTEYIEPIDPTLIAHWALDEVEGITAHDSASGNDGFALGSPVWQPTGGVVGGAIELDGVDDYVITGLVLDSADGPFSVFAWSKGGRPNQVVISQTMSANWLMADAGSKLITELKGIASFTESLSSETVITDGNWHLIGFVWDGLHRRLYVDDVAAAEDTQEDLDVRSAGLYIGAGKNAGAGTYWSGLIDDVRIYNAALNAERIAGLGQ